MLYARTAPPADTHAPAPPYRARPAPLPPPPRARTTTPRAHLRTTPARPLHHIPLVAPSVSPYISPLVSPLIAYKPIFGHIPAGNSVNQVFF